MNELTTIGKAHEYVTHYLNDKDNQYDQITSYQHSHNTTYDNAKAHASRFHNSPAVKEAFITMIGNSIPEHFKTRDGVVLEADKLYQDAKNDDSKHALSVLKFIADVLQHTSKDNITIHNTQASITTELTQEEKTELAQRIRNSTSIV